MRTCLFVFAAATALSALPAQDAKLTVLHGVPGLPAAVDVRANGASLFSFTYGEQRGPLSLPAGAYALEVRLNGAPILSANANVAAGGDYSVIAHLDAGGTPRLAVFQNGVQPLALPAARLYVRHTAQAPAVDVVLEQNSVAVATIPNLANGQSASADVAPGRYAARLVVAGTSTTAFGPVDFVVENGNGYGLFAVGDVSGPSFRLLTQTLPLAPRVTVVHGIPGLPAPVTVRANGASLFSFDYRSVRGPLVIAPGSYAFDVLLNGVPVLARNDTLTRFDDVTVVAHLDASGTPTLSAFANATQPVPSGRARVTVRHLAQAPAVDVAVDDQATRLATIPGLRNGQEAIAELPTFNLGVSLFAAGTATRVFGPANLRPVGNTSYEVLALGSLTGGTFTVEVLQRDLLPAVAGQLTTRVGGWSCGPTISASPSTFDFGQTFELRVHNAAPGAMALVNYGDSITSAGGAPLPISLQQFGAPSCFLATNVVAVLGAITDANGRLAIGYTVPRALFGRLAPGYFQVGVMDGSNALGWTTSEYLELR